MTPESGLSVTEKNIYIDSFDVFGKRLSGK
jgi:hypothetical protein